jgi:hypothetical protein
MIHRYMLDVYEWRTIKAECDRGQRAGDSEE